MRYEALLQHNVCKRAAFCSRIVWREFSESSDNDEGYHDEAHAMVIAVEAHRGSTQGQQLALSSGLW